MTEKSSIESVCREISENRARIEQRLCDAAVAAGRSRGEIRLMAVTKTVSPVFINHALSLGIDLIGENKVQELLSKLDHLQPPGVSKHLIGHLQSNKARKIADVVDMVQSVDGVPLARELSRQALLHGRDMEILLEVNVGGEASKTGFDPAAVPEAAAEISELPGLVLRGVMSVPPICETEAEARGYFAATRRIYGDLRAALGGRIDTLSMGMSSDYEAAVAEGSTLVRIGSALFGARHY